MPNAAYHPSINRPIETESPSVPPLHQLLERINAVHNLAMEVEKVSTQKMETLFGVSRHAENDRKEAQVHKGQVYMGIQQLEEILLMFSNVRTDLVRL